MLVASLCKQNANRRPPKWPNRGEECLWSLNADYLPVDLLLIIIHVYKLSSLGKGQGSGCIRDEQTGAAIAHSAGHEFIHG